MRKWVLAVAMIATVPAAAMAADADAGKTVFNKCKACHQRVGAKNIVGPHLDGIVGRKVASVEEGFTYSDASKTPDVDVGRSKPQRMAAGTDRRTFPARR